MDFRKWVHTTGATLQSYTISLERACSQPQVDIRSYYRAGTVWTSAAKKTIVVMWYMGVVKGKHVEDTQDVYLPCCCCCSHML